MTLTDNESASRYFRNLGVSNPASRVDKVGSNPTCRDLTPFNFGGGAERRATQTSTGAVSEGWQNGNHPLARTEDAKYATTQVRTDETPDSRRAWMLPSRNTLPAQSSFEVYPKSPLCAGIAIASAIATAAVIGWLVLGGLS